MHFDFLYGTKGMQRHRDPSSPPIDPGLVLRHGQPNLVLLRRSGELTEKHMYENADEWSLLYQDAIAQVWGRKSVYDAVESADYLSQESRIKHDRLATDSVTWPAINSWNNARPENGDEIQLVNRHPQP